MSNYVPSSVWVNNMNPMKEIFIPKVYKKLAPEIRFIEIQNYIFNIGNVSGIEISKHFDIKINVVRADLKKLMDKNLIISNIDISKKNEFKFCKRYSKKLKEIVVINPKISLKDQIIEYVIANGPCTTLCIATKLNCKQNTVRSSLLKGKKANLIKSKLHKNELGLYNLHSGV